MYNKILILDDKVAVFTLFLKQISALTQQKKDLTSIAIFNQ